MNRSASTKRGGDERCMLLHCVQMQLHRLLRLLRQLHLRDLLYRLLRYSDRPWLLQPQLQSRLRRSGRPTQAHLPLDPRRLSWRGQLYLQPPPQPLNLLRLLQSLLELQLHLPLFPRRVDVPEVDHAVVAEEDYVKPS